MSTTRDTRPHGRGFLSPSYGRRLGKVVAAAVDPIKCLQSMLCEACPPEDDHPASDASAALVG